MKRLSLIAIGLLALPVFPACDDAPTEPPALQTVPEADDPTRPPPPPDRTRASLEVIPESYTIGIGGTYQLEAIYRTSQGKNVNKNVLAEWSSSDPAVAAVSSNGRVRGRALGRAVITARFQGLRAQSSVWVIQFPEDDDPKDDDPRG